MTSTTIRTDDETMKKIKKLAKELGISLNSLINALLKKTIREGGVDLRNASLTENGFSEDFEESVLKADQDDNYQTFNSVQEMIKAAKK